MGAGRAVRTIPLQFPGPNALRRLSIGRFWPNNLHGVCLRECLWAFSFAVRVPCTATWSELVSAVAATEEARDYSVRTHTMQAHHNQAPLTFRCLRCVSLRSLTCRSDKSNKPVARLVPVLPRKSTYLCSQSAHLYSYAPAPTIYLDLSIALLIDPFALLSGTIALLWSAQISSCVDRHSLSLDRSATTPCLPGILLTECG